MNEERFRLNYEKAIEVSRKAVAMLERKIPPFNQPNIFPDVVLPSGMEVGSLEHALFLFYACSLDSMRQAKSVYEAMRGIASETDLKELCRLGRKDLTRLVKKHLEEPGSVGEPIETLYWNARKLEEEYKGDPRNIAEKSVEETIKRVQKGRPRSEGKFRQFGPGKAALLMKNFVRFGIWHYDPCQIPIKIDRHVVRISIGTSVVETEGQELKAQHLVKPLSGLYRKVTSQERISAVDLDDALWGIGSQLCIRNQEYVCRMGCDLGCVIRPWADRHAYLVKPRQESRKAERNLLLFEF